MLAGPSHYSPTQSGWRPKRRFAAAASTGSYLSTSDGETVGDGVEDGVTDGDVENDGVTDGEVESDGVTDGEVESDGVTDGDVENDGVTDGDGVNDGVPDGLGVNDGVGVVDAVNVGVLVTEPVNDVDFVNDTEPVYDPVIDGLDDHDDDFVVVGVTDGDGVGEGEQLWCSSTGVVENTPTRLYADDVDMYAIEIHH